jgi:chemotaxis protein methyltransferase CheR
LTNQESYFFRDQGQFDLLREIIVPGLIENNRDSRTLRIWSAGCSTGEEPYSLAILVDQLLPLRTDWRVQILGTDLSDAALEKARRGIYGSWSFRMMNPDTVERYFQPRQNSWELQSRIRRMVTFRHGNLLQDEYPSAAGGTNDLDLILCRNVFIYFKREAVARVVDKMNRCLREGGYLITGHAELHDTPLGGLRPRSFPQTIVYQRTKAPTRPVPAPPAPQVRTPLSLRPGMAPPGLASKATKVPPRPAIAPPVEPEKAVLSEAIESARTLLIQGDSQEALKALAPYLPPQATQYAPLCLAAQALANLARYEEAAALCAQAQQLRGFASLPAVINARISEEGGDYDAAKSHLRRAIYLEPRLTSPYLELAALYAREGDVNRAATMRSAALAGLEGLTDDEWAPHDPLCIDPRHKAGELRRFLQEGF